jgi:serine/threonine protein kinase
VVHGDLTGSNILINVQGKPCLCDFGLSKILAEFEGTSYFTGTRGAVRWAAIELYRGLDEDDYLPVINKQCDIYSYGSVMLQASETYILVQCPQVGFLI